MTSSENESVQILTQVSGIYRIRNLVNGRMYIGSSVNIAQRVWANQSTLETGSHTNPHLQADWNSLGKQAFVFELVLVTGDSHAELDKAELRFIGEAQSAGLAYNSPHHRGRRRRVMGRRRQRNERVISLRDEEIAAGRDP